MRIPSSRTARGPLALAGLTALVVAGLALVSAPGSAVDNVSSQSERVDICHATGNGGHVLITVDEDAVAAHMTHQEGQDFFPTNGSCGSASATPTVTVTATQTATATATATQTATATATATQTAPATATATQTATATATATQTATTVVPGPTVTVTATATPTIGATVSPVGALNICHANGDGTYTTLAVDANATFGGHLADAADIIPPVGAFAGQNWTADGQAIFTNGCVVPVLPAVIAPAEANLPGGGAVAPLPATIPLGVAAGGGSSAPAAPPAGLLLLLLGAAGAAIAGIRLAAARA